MYQWLLGALGALLAAARRPPPAPAPPPRKRPPPSIQPPVEDPDQTRTKKQKSDYAISGRKEKASAEVKLPAKATSERQKASVSHAAPIAEPAEETQYTSNLSSKRPRGSAIEMLQIDKMTCGTSTCLNKETLSLPHKKIPCQSTSRNGKCHVKPASDSILTQRPPIKERAVPEPTPAEAGKMGRLFCTAEEDVQRGEKAKYKQLLQLVKEKHPRSCPNPQLTSFCNVQAHSKEPVRTVSHLEEQKRGEVHPCMRLRTGTKRSDVCSPQWSQRSDMARCYAPAENSHGQGRPVKQATAGAMEREVVAALGKGDPEEVLSSAFKLKVTREDIRTLRSLRWLNDEVINFYMCLLVERNKKEGYPAVHAFSTFFYTKLISEGYKAVRRWTRGVDLFKQDLILVPIHLRVHWALVVIDVRKKTIKYFDSMGQKGDKICEALFQYLQEESREKRNLELTVSEWTLHSMESREIPQQLNGSDCGVFMCKYADYISRDKPITFTENHMPYFRKKMVWEIIHQQLLRDMHY
ncbi:sentrin-specific protease 2 isoform X2 [Tyto alba]|uniref:sentrin-specific protease 2 isoform X2 n=1 Tax=Tyto alba TaxID=56313 RepID=UPI001C67B195|nr:sentrin-specific protease 2 isoform X2 [Tyto alba]